MLSRLSLWLNRTSEAVCCGVLLAMTVVVVLQVICRYLLGAALTWSEEFARFGLVWITFLGAGIALRRRAHVGVQVIVELFSPGVRKIVQVFTIFTVVGFLLIATFKGMELALFNMKQYSPAMGLPMGLVYLAIPSGCLVLIIQLAEQLLDLLRPSPGKVLGEAGD
ncbi:MAG: TRAP transporter small permease [Deltaproteobacteria bacterium]|nr:MAG: TRAP transporter small permease [Deltaproteobacteria bacterium]